jgi:hypothetical protein
VQAEDDQRERAFDDQVIAEQSEGRRRTCRVAPCAESSGKQQGRDGEAKNQRPNHLCGERVIITHLSRR